MTKVGLPGAKEGWKKVDVTKATVLKSQGYATGQFGKNHHGHARIDERDQQAENGRVHPLESPFGADEWIFNDHNDYAMNLATA
jgi:arylsulfatase A-like enzyme